MNARGHNGQGGFSLLELLVAFVIMAMALGMLYRASGGAVRAVADTEQAARVNLLARSLLDSRDSVPPQGWQEAGESGGIAWQARSAPLAAPAAGAGPRLHEVHFALRWTDGRGEQHLELKTLLPEAQP